MALFYSQEMEQADSCIVDVMITNPQSGATYQLGWQPSYIVSIRSGIRWFGSLIAA